MARPRRALAVAHACALAALIAAPAAGAAVYTVNTVADNLPLAGECGGLPGDCSLRQALDRAQNTDIVRVPAGTYTLVNQEIGVRGGVSIEGAGPEATVISGAGSDQAFELLGGAPTRIAGLSITDTYNDSGEPQGGAISAMAQSGEDLTVEDVSITDSSSPDGYGGAIETGSALTVRHSRFSGDTAARGGGGAIDLFPGGEPALEVSDSVFEGDSAGSYGGGAILVEGGGSLAVSASTFARDTSTAGAPGGALQLDARTTGTIYNSTFTLDTAGLGGAVSSEASQLALVNDTLDADGAQMGAGLAVSAGRASVQNTIFGAPFGGGGSCSGKVASAGHNLDEASPSTCGLSAKAGDLVGGNPELGALGVNASIDPTAGGPPETLAPGPGSPALGAGSAAGCAAVGSVDERGFPRPGAGSVCDVGAFEALAPVGTATTLSSSSSSTVSGTLLTLSASVASTQQLPGAVPPAQGQVEFRDGSQLLGEAPIGAGGSATLQVSDLPLGTQTLSAVYPGDAVHLASSSLSLEEIVLAPTPAPVLSALRETHRHWRAGRALARVASVSQPVGTTFSFAVNTASTVRFTFTRTLAGRSVGGRCERPNVRNRGHRRCRRDAAVGSVDIQMHHGGGGELFFQGRISRALRLSPGRYHALVSARNSVGSSPQQSIGFTILGN